MADNPNAPANPLVPPFYAVLAAISFLGFFYFLSLAGTIVTEAPAVISIPWAPSMGVTLDFYIDGLSLLFALMILGIGGIIFLYSGGYFLKHPEAFRIGILLFLFAISMLGVVVVDNLITLFVFWELTTLTSYFLIGTDHNVLKARKLAWQALLVTGTGGLALLASFVLIGMATGTYQISEIIQQDLTGHSTYGWIFWLLILGCFTKSAQYPFHFWLPNAMAAPTPISAFLHSATMVKAGLFLMARCHPFMGGTDLWFYTLVIGGQITAVWASIVALKQSDMKLMMAYTTLMALGTVTLFLGGDSELAFAAAMTFVLVHSLYKAAMFMVVGNIEKCTGTRDWSKVSGLGKAIPITGTTALLTGLSMAGFPPLFGFIGKELQYKSALGIANQPFFIMLGVFIAAALMAGIAFFVIARVFWWAPLNPSREHCHKVPYLMSLPILLLGIGSLAFGLFPVATVEKLVLSSVNAIQALPPDYHGKVHLHLWHGFNFVLFLSVITAIVGVLVAWRFSLVSKLTDQALAKIPFKADDGYDGVLNGILRFADWQTSVLQNGRQRYYGMTVFGTLIVLGAMALYPRGFSLVAPSELFATVALHHWIVVGVIVVATLVAVRSNSRMLTICALGVVGTGIALIFVMFSAPDVAMTQFMIEIMVVIIMTTVMLKLPRFKGESHGSGFGRGRDLVVAIGAGGLVTLAMLNATHGSFDPRLTEYFMYNSYYEAHGRNIVNVILVDFRAFDTMGEILVVAIAGLAGYALIKGKVPSRGDQQQ